MKRLLPWMIIIGVVVIVAYGAGHFLFGSRPSAPPANAQRAEGHSPGIPADQRPPDHGLHKPTEPPAPPEPTAADIYQEAIREDEKGDTAAAVPLYQQVIQMEPRGEAAANSALRLAVIHLAKGDKPNARQYYSLALKYGNWTQPRRQAIIGQLTKLASQSVATATYTVKKGDCLAKIAKKYKITAALLKKINSLNSDLIRIDDELKVVGGPFDAVVDRSDLTITVMHQGKFVKQYKVGLGKDGRTPTGSFCVISKLVEPDWYTPEGIIPFGDPENILGTRWVGFRKGYGIHGTNQPDTIGTYCSNGCVRMHNKDVEEVYDLLVTKHSKVVVQE